MNLTTVSAELSQSFKAAHQIWEDTRRGWKDIAAADFEMKHWTPMADQVTAVVDVLDQLEPALARLYRECS
ncbi:MAG: hypothetical protein ACRD36_03255 [Candidatus Acidiferrum sp.]